MDEDVSTWVLEFLLRQPIEERIINGILASLPFKDENNRLKKTLLLRKIEFEVSNASISEKLLDLMEIIEEIDHRSGQLPSDSMKHAYCSVAVDCAVRFLDENVMNNAKYFEAVKRVWRERVCKMENFESEETKQKMEEIEAALWDSEACRKLAKINTRNETLKSLRAYLAEAWASLGPAFIELAAKKVGNALEELRGGGTGGGAAGPANACRELAAIGETRKVQPPVRRKHVAMKSKRGKGAKISDPYEGDEDKFTSKADDTAAPKEETVPDAKKSSSMELDAIKEANLPNAFETTQTMPSTNAKDHITSETLLDNQTGSKVSITTPEVDRVREALKTSSMELHAAVKDPLPDALQIAETISSTLVAKSMSNEPVTENPRGPESDAPKQPSAENERNEEKRDNPPEDSRDNEEQNRMTAQNPKRTLMEPNETAHTYEWDDSVDCFPGGPSKRPRLPSPKEIKPVPLKNFEDMKLTRRRVRKRWTNEEEDTLRAGVQKFGRGNWKLILSAYREVFQERTEVDLKDKWRNLTRYP